jgi:hypothetical protein
MIGLKNGVLAVSLGAPEVLMMQSQTSSYKNSVYVIAAYENATALLIVV